jgi:hypothetical protein
MAAHAIVEAEAAMISLILERIARLHFRVAILGSAYHRRPGGYKSAIAMSAPPARAAGVTAIDGAEAPPGAAVPGNPDVCSPLDLR